MSRFWSPFVRDLEPYVPGEQPKMARLVKLNTNEQWSNVYLLPFTTTSGTAKNKLDLTISIHNLMRRNSTPVLDFWSFP